MGPSSCLLSVSTESIISLFCVCTWLQYEHQTTLQATFYFQELVRSKLIKLNTKYLYKVSIWSKMFPGSFRHFYSQLVCMPILILIELGNKSNWLQWGKLIISTFPTDIPYKIYTCDSRLFIILVKKRMNFNISFLLPFLVGFSFLHIKIQR